jgi:hypothetical protein
VVHLLEVPKNKIIISQNSPVLSSCTHFLLPSSRLQIPPLPERGACIEMMTSMQSGCFICQIFHWQPSQTQLFR